MSLCEMLHAIFSQDRIINGVSTIFVDMFYNCKEDQQWLWSTLWYEESAMVLVHYCVLCICETCSPESHQAGHQAVLPWPPNWKYFTQHNKKIVVTHIIMFFLTAAILLVSSASAYSTEELEDVSDPRLFFANYTSGKERWCFEIVYSFFKVVFEILCLHFKGKLFKVTCHNLMFLYKIRCWWKIDIFPTIYKVLIDYISLTIYNFSIFALFSLRTIYQPESFPFSHELWMTFSPKFRRQMSVDLKLPVWKQKLNCNYQTMPLMDP